MTSLAAAVSHSARQVPSVVDPPSGSRVTHGVSNDKSLHGPRRGAILTTYERKNEFPKLISSPPDSHIPQVFSDYSPQTAGDSDHSHTACICRHVLGQLPAQTHTFIQMIIRNENIDAFKHETKTAPWSGISIRWGKELPISWRVLILMDLANNMTTNVLNWTLRRVRVTTCAVEK